MTALFAVAMGVYAVLFFRLDGSGSLMGWGCTGLAVLGTLYGMFLRALNRDCRHLLAVAPEADRTS